MGSAGAAAAALSQLFEGPGGDDEVESQLTPPFRPRRGLPEIFRFAEQIHEARTEGAETHGVDAGSDFPGIAGAVILRDSEHEDDLPPSEYPTE